MEVCFIYLQDYSSWIFLTRFDIKIDDIVSVASKKITLLTSIDCTMAKDINSSKEVVILTSHMLVS